MERVVQTREDICWAIKALKHGKTVVCVPSMKPLLVFEARKENIPLEIEDDGFCYEIIPQIETPQTETPKLRR